MLQGRSLQSLTTTITTTATTTTTMEYPQFLKIPQLVLFTVLPSPSLIVATF